MESAKPEGCSNGPASPSRGGCKGSGFLPNDSLYTLSEVLMTIVCKPRSGFVGRTLRLLVPHFTASNAALSEKTTRVVI
ncbi:MAG: hypothetical protein J6M53_06350 [Bacteroidaceae bacterium]|nr:hypothetical protein [Bacteroidaceae bacterium]